VGCCSSGVCGGGAGVDDGVVRGCGGSVAGGVWFAVVSKGNSGGGVVELGDCFGERSL